MIAARLGLALSLVVLAGFHPAASFEKSANEGGGGGLAYTGALRGKGYDCTICHVDSDAVIAVELTSAPAGLRDGVYMPGTAYAITLDLTGEHRGFGAVSNQNTFLAEVVTDADAPAGAFTAVDLDEFALVDGGRVLAARAGSETTWTFDWTAPAAGTGAVTFHLGVVDGDGAGNTARASTDPVGDDVAVLALRLCESSAGCADRARRERDASPAAGCSTAGGEAGGVIVVLLALALLHRRRAVVLLVALAACFDPTTPEECPNRICGQDPGDLVDAGPACAESWECTTWAAPPGSDQATRTCTDRNQAGTTECKPSEGPVTLPALDLDYYKCRVSPIIQRGCSMMGCHGTDAGRAFRTYARGRLRNDQIVNRTGTCIPSSGQVNLQEAGTGTVMCEGWLPHTAEEWKKNFDSARSFMLDVTNPADSDLLLMPVVGGKPHIEIKLFRDTEADYTTIRDWLGGARLGMTCNTGVN